MKTILILAAAGGLCLGSIAPASEADARRDIAAGVRAQADRDVPVIALFIAVEEFARLPEAEQAKRLPAFYREVAPQLMSPMIEGIVSSFPAKVLERDGNSSAPGGAVSLGYAQQIQDVAALPPREVADRIVKAHSGMILKVATKGRCIQALLAHRKALAALAKEDLGGDADACRRALSTIVGADLRELTPEIVRIYLSDDPRAEEARGALIWQNDDSVLPALIKDIQDKPARLARHYGLMNGMLWGKPADPVLLRLLDSPEAETRYQAAIAVQDCRDDALAAPALKLIKDADPRIRVAAVHMTGQLSADAHRTVRPDLLKLLESGDLELRLETAAMLAKRKDAAAGPVLLASWQTGLSENDKVRVMQAVGALTGGTFNYDMHHWAEPTNQNREAMREFQEWIDDHPAPR